MKLEQQAYIDHLLSSERYSDPRCLTRHGFKVLSQNDEDGIIAEIFRRIGPHNRRFVEFGVEKGIETNSGWLLMQGWSGLWIEAGAEKFDTMQQTHRGWIDGGQLDIRHSRVDRDNINGLIASSPRAEGCDLLSVDIDSNDYWVWEAIAISPAVVVIEYNAHWPPPVEISIPYDPAASWDGTNWFGASLSALAALGERKGYKLVGCGLAGVNAFFVRADLVGDKFLAPGDVNVHFEPPRFFLAALNPGHPPALRRPHLFRS